MPSNSLLPSYLGNITAQRQRLSAARQQLGLESKPGTGMKNVHPTPEAPANKAGAAQQAVQAEFDYDSFIIPPEKEAAMLEKIQGWIDRNNNGVDDRQEAAQTSATPKQPTGTTTAKDPRVAGALGPLASFFKQNSRLPDVDELRTMMASRELKEQLGREPTETEALLYRAKPPKTG